MTITIILIIVASTTVYWLLRRYIKRLIVGNIRADAQVSKVVQEIIGEVNALIVEFNGITDRNVTIVEDRIARLSSLVDKSRYAIKILSNYSFDSITPANVTTDTPDTFDISEHHQSLAHSVDTGTVARDDSIDNSGQYSVGTVHQSRTAMAQISGHKEDIVSHIRRLHQQQVDIATISKQVGIPIGEVETYISLFGSDSS